MNRIATLVVAGIAIFMMACNSTKAHEGAQGEPGSKYLILYYSQTGVTKAVAEELQKALGADIERIEAVEPYAGSYDETIERCLKEREAGVVPAAKPLKADLGKYDVVLIGYPIWFGTYASPVMDVLARYDFAGKKVVPFATFGSGGLEASAADLAKALPKAEVAEGYGVREVRIGKMPAELHRFLVEQGYVEGEVTPLPAFGEELKVSAEEAKIFDEACGDYPFPLGTPLTVAHRATDEGTEYRYTVDTTTPDGSHVDGTVYIIVEPGKKAEFTKVVR